MAKGEIVETIYGKYHKYEIEKNIDSGILTFGSKITFYILRDGKPYRGSYSSLSDAVEAAKKEG